MTALGLLIDELNSQSYHVSWSSTLDAPGLFVPAHHLVVLAADRSDRILVEVVQDVLARISTTV